MAILYLQGKSLYLEICLLKQPQGIKMRDIVNINGDKSTFLWKGHTEI